MHEDQLQKFVGMVSDIAYEMHDKDWVDDKLREMFLELWRQFSSYSDNK